MMRKIAVFTSTRAEYGLLRPLMQAVAARPLLELQLIVSGTHLSPAHGMTVRGIEADGFPIAAQVDMQVGDDSALAAANSAACVLTGVAQALERLQPDLLILLGDRYELLAAAQAAVLCHVPIVHLHGGETTEGALDEFVRHAVTKLSHFHFASAPVNAERILQMGEDCDRVWTVGALAMDNIAALDVLPRQRLEQDLGIPLRSPSFLVTYHPVTLDPRGGAAAVRHMLEALDETGGSIIVTGTNADPGASPIRETLQAFAATRTDRVVIVESLGTQRYLSLMHWVDAVVGNSSSGLLEAPAVGVPTLDIGDRQKGRLSAPSVIHCNEDPEAVRQALAQVLSPSHRALSQQRDTPYGRPGVAQRMVELLESLPLPVIRKPFVHRSIPTP